MGGISIWSILLIMILIPFAFLPTIIAIIRNHPYKLPIIIINIFGALIFGLGWVIALIWSLILPQVNLSLSRENASEIAALFELKEKGALTDEEFEIKKKELL
jgi:hypothetical protein